MGDGTIYRETQLDIIYTGRPWSTHLQMGFLPKILPHIELSGREGRKSLRVRDVRNPEQYGHREEVN